MSLRLDRCDWHAQRYAGQQRGDKGEVRFHSANKACSARPSESEAIRYRVGSRIDEALAVEVDRIGDVVEVELHLSRARLTGRKPGFQGDRLREGLAAGRMRAGRGWEEG